MDGLNFRQLVKGHTEGLFHKDMFSSPQPITGQTGMAVVTCGNDQCVDMRTVDLELRIGGSFIKAIFPPGMVSTHSTS